MDIYARMRGGVDARYIEWGVAEASDGCTLFPDFFLPACYEHDYHCVHGKTIDDKPITCWEASSLLARRIRSYARDDDVRMIWHVMAPVVCLATFIWNWRTWPST